MGKEIKALLGHMNREKGMQSNTFKYGYYAPMEDESLDIRKYIQDKLGINP